MKLIQDPKVEELFNSYPTSISQKLRVLRQLILATAEEEAIVQLNEVVKWGEPGYLAKNGSTIRLGTVKGNSKQYAMYFTCTTSLVATFMMVYGDQLHFEGNRAIVLNIEDEVPVAPLKHCISLALKYHKIKNLPMLGV